jgi:hypothetical protein
VDLATPETEIWERRGCSRSRGRGMEFSPKANEKSDHNIELVPQKSAYRPNIAVSPENNQVWMR